MLSETDEPTRVAAGIIRNDEHVLLCQRGFNHRYAMKWEFPGGKTIPGETLAECLERELSEELNVEPTVFKELKTVRFTYSDGGNFLITFFVITGYTGEVVNRVFEKIEWVKISDLRNYDILEGTLPILPYLS
jgi:8-oxo-dGTP diphosphatase